MFMMNVFNVTVAVVGVLCAGYLLLSAVRRTREPRFAYVLLEADEGDQFQVTLSATRAARWFRSGHEVRVVLAERYSAEALASISEQDTKEKDSVRS